MVTEELYKLLWAIFVAEGACKASVPFGYLPLKGKWQKKQVSFLTVLKRVAAEIRLEHAKWLKALEEKKFNGDFIRWLARVGYNANPAEWDQWERNVRSVLKQLQ